MVKREDIHGENGRIGYLLRQANTMQRLKADRLLAPFHVTVPQYSILTFCSIYPGISNADLARLTLLTPQTLSVIVVNLERKGLIARLPHEIHGRIQHIELTETGTALLKKCDPPILSFHQKLTEGLSPDEEKIIRRWLVKVAATLS